MKKLLLVVVVFSFIGLAFAFSPARITNDYTQNETVLLEDTTKTKKKAKKDCAKKSCCEKKCSNTKKKEKKKENN